MVIILIIVLVLSGIFLMSIIAAYSVLAIFLSKFNKLIYDKETALAWIPICNVYLLGKLAVNKIVGWLLVGGFFLTVTYKTTYGVVKEYSILPESIRLIASLLYGLVVLGLLIYAIVKYFKIKKSGNVTLQQQNNNQINNM